jgi:hypothetical protein
MKTLLILPALLISLASVSLHAQEGLSLEPVLSLESNIHDFGEISKDKPVTAEFEFVNEGATPLIILDTKASCGCTVAEYTKDPIPPGGKGIIKAVYNAKNQGIFNKSITVTTNMPDPVLTLYIKGEVRE